MTSPRFLICFLIAVQALQVKGQGTLILSTGYADGAANDQNKGRMVKSLTLGASMESDCPSWKNNTGLIVAATGGMVEGEIIICGGYDESKSADHDSKFCFELGDEEDNTNMTKARTLAASLVYNGYLWVTGGRNDVDDDLQTTEWISLKKDNMAGPDLPEKMSGHCLTGVNSTHAMLIADSTKTWAYNYAEKTFTATAAYSINGRTKFGCAAFMNAKMDNKTTVVVVGGGKQSVEFYDPMTDTWTAGPDMPVEIDKMATMKNHKGDGVLVVGGEIGNTLQKDIYELICTSTECKWIKLDKTLDVGMAEHVAILTCGCDYEECSGATRVSLISSLIMILVSVLILEF